MDLRLLLKCDKLNNYPFPNLVVCRTNVILVSSDKYFCRSSVHKSYQQGSLLTHQHNPLPPQHNPLPPQPMHGIFKIKNTLKQVLQHFSSAPYLSIFKKLLLKVAILPEISE